MRLEAEKSLAQQLQVSPLTRTAYVAASDSHSCRAVPCLQDELEGAQEKKAHLKARLSEATAELELLRNEEQGAKAAAQDKTVLLAQVEIEVRSHVPASGD